MRIAFDIAALDRGGAERQTLEVATGLVDLGHEVLIIVNKRADQFTEYYERVQITELHRTSIVDLRVAPDIRRALGVFRADVCVCVMFNASLWGRLAAASLRCPVVVVEHSTRAVTPLDERVTNVLLRGATESVVACADAQVEALLRGGHQRRKIRVIRNGVNIEHFRRDDRGAARMREDLGIPPDASVVMLAAAHRAEKRHDRFVSLIERLHDMGTPAWGLMVGDGPLLEETAALAAESRVSDRLRVTGSITDMPVAYSAADVVVLVTTAETFPLCFLEAQACEVPVVGMEPGGIRETLAEGRTGFVVEQGDVESMATIVAALLSDRGLRANAGRAGREFVSEHLTVQAMIDGYAKVLADAVSGKPEGR